MQGNPSLVSQEFHSILFPQPNRAGQVLDASVPACFHDLNLDRLVDAVAARAAEYELAPFFYVRVDDADEVAYRQEVMRDLERSEALREAIAAFAASMRAMREHRERVQKCFYKQERERWLLEAMSAYANAVERLTTDVRQLGVTSRGLIAFGDYLAALVEGDVFKRLAADTRTVLADLSGIRYAVHIKGSTVTLRHDEDEADFSAMVEATFAKFRQGTTRDYRARFDVSSLGLNHVEAQILERVALLFPEVFHTLENYVDTHANDADACLVQFDREIQFYLAYFSHMQACRRRGLTFCYPQVSRTCKAIEAHDVFDLALATRMLEGSDRVVRNDFHLDGAERVFVVSGPNHGGKTTFARTVGQMHWLAGLGLPVPGTQAQLFLCDQIFTHFEREEDITSLRGKLKDDLVRIHHILDQVTPDSLVIMNEIFASTTLQDATWLGRKVMARLSELDLLAVCVTFLPELAMFDEKTVSMMSLVDPHDPAIRTCKVERKPADGVAYALAIAEKFRVTRRWLLQRIAP
ncbi:MAG: hypothetical protein ABI114_10170 [Rhodanobacter sp.]